MKKQIFAAALVCASLLALNAKDADPVLMNVAGKDVPLSEFEYLFHKNNSQQTRPQALDEYVNMFVDYKLKVADAEAAGIDTTASFLKEFNQFRDELAEPYMRDNSVLEDMVAETYSHMTEEVFVSHIMLPAGKETLADSLREALVAGTAVFEDVARQYSMDKPSAAKGGRMGFAVPGRYPWAFEEAAYNTPVGQLSPVINSGFGLHIIRPESRTPARGEVNAEHILRMTRGVNDSIAAAQEVIIDSIYNIVAADPSKFEELARTMSQDPGSARNGGSLGWFGPGVMVQEFDSVSFALPVGAVSRPFKTAFGWHIIKKLDRRGIAALEDSRENILKSIENSPRANAPHQAYINRKAAQYGARLYQDNIDRVGRLADAKGGVLDSAMIAVFAQSALPIYTVAGKDVTLADIAGGLQPGTLRGGTLIQQQVSALAESRMNDDVLSIAREELLATEPDYRNLVNEYRDGILLFEISNRNVWERASKDTEGLKAYFDANRDKYAWDVPKFKSYIIFATNDSIANAALAYADTLDGIESSADLTAALREKFGRDVKVERVIAARGENPITDYLGFRGPRPDPDASRWNSYVAFRPKVITAPEEPADVRGAVVSDYQTSLEKEWLKQLHDKYSYKINQKVLKKVH